jgi:hypothetical protein
MKLSLRGDLNRKAIEEFGDISLRKTVKVIDMKKQDNQDNGPNEAPKRWAIDCVSL